MSKKLLIIIFRKEFCCFCVDIVLQFTYISIGGEQMETANINIRTDKKVKNAAEKIFEALGINMSTAVNIFLRQTIRENGIPFELKLNTPNEITANAITEGRSIAHDESIKGYSNIQELREALDE